MQTDPSGSALLPRSLTLRNGRMVTVRPICPDDKDALEAGFERLCSESRYTRFFGAVRDIPDSVLESSCHPLPEREVALVAISHEGPEPVMTGTARFVCNPSGDACEFAITVADDWHGLGLATQLMETLIAIAKAKGLQRMEGSVLSANTPMRGLAKRLGFTEAACPGDYSVRTLSLTLS
jgi:RimJ/RimL family protein N-acetyltransferase